MNSIMSSTYASNFRNVAGSSPGGEGPQYPFSIPGVHAAAARQTEDSRFNLYGVQQAPHMELVGQGLVAQASVQMLSGSGGVGDGAGLAQQSR